MQRIKTLVFLGALLFTIFARADKTPIELGPYRLKGGLRASVRIVPDPNSPAGETRVHLTFLVAGLGPKADLKGSFLIFKGEGRPEEVEDLSEEEIVFGFDHTSVQWVGNLVRTPVLAVKDGVPSIYGLTLLVSKNPVLFVDPSEHRRTPLIRDLPIGQAVLGCGAGVVEQP